MVTRKRGPSVCHAVDACVFPSFGLKTPRPAGTRVCNKKQTPPAIFFLLLCSLNLPPPPSKIEERGRSLVVWDADRWKGSTWHAPGVEPGIRSQGGSEDGKVTANREVSKVVVTGAVGGTWFNKTDEHRDELVRGAHFTYLVTGWQVTREARLKFRFRTQTSAP